jgi:hypothetical protein
MRRILRLQRRCRGQQGQQESDQAKAAHVVASERGTMTTQRSASV